MNKQWMWVVTPVVLGVFLIGLLFLAGSAPVSSSAGGVQIEDVVVGEGPEAEVGDEVEVHYTGRLKNGMKFDSSYDHKGKEPFTFRLGAGDVIKGWDKGVAGMKVGGERKLIIPPALGYGARGFPPQIPPNAELHFDIKLLKIK